MKDLAPALEAGVTDVTVTVVLVALLAQVRSQQLPPKHSTLAANLEDEETTVALRMTGVTGEGRVVSGQKA